MSLTGWLLWAGYMVALVCIVGSLAWTVVLFIAGNRYSTRWRHRPPGDESRYLWVFLTPALNEGVTIADSVGRIRSVRATNKIMLVINDGSEDDTGTVLESLAGPDLEVLTRVPPHARTGKAAALNAAFQHVRDTVLTQPQYRDWTSDRIVFAIVDADGRLAPDAPAIVSRHFDEARVAGVQVSVDIYNQESWLTRMQGLEFLVFGGLFQVGRSEWGAAFMGGNGQFNRMSALQSVSSAEGPWSHYLTEDQELGLRLLERGWYGVHEPNTSVSQQGLNSLRLLYRQRTRWMQGNLQVFGDLRRLHSHHLVGIRRWDALFTLTMPVVMLVIGVALIGALILAIFFGVDYVPWGNPWLLAMFLVLGFGPVTLGTSVLARGQGWRGVSRVLRAALPYIAYSWLMWPVTFRGMVRQLRGHTSWTKTTRERITAPPDPTTPHPPAGSA